jgi:HupE / UreJ protein
MIIPRVVGCLAVLLIAVPPARVAAHDIPVDVAVQAFVKPEGGRLRLLVRVPLEAMRDAEIPTRGPGYVDLGRVDAALRDAAILWIADAIEIYEGDTRLTDPRVPDVRVSLLGDQSFRSYQEALAHVTGPRLTDATNLFWNQGMLDVLLEYPIRSERSAFSIHPRLARLGVRVTTALRFLPPGGAVRAFEYPGDPGLVRLDPRWHQAARRFVTLGFLHILDGTDHLLFLLCLVVPFRRFRALVPIVTAFTVAHSVTLMASAYDYAPDALWFPPLVETLIAMSIVYMALENIAAGVSVRRRWMITFGFGLVHGFGFSFALRETLQFAGSHLLTSLLAFNLGVELGQLLVLALMIPALALLFRFVVDERMGTIILSALVAHTAWHWMIERGERLRLYSRPALDIMMLVTAMRWLMLIVIVAGLAWLVFGVLRRQAAPTTGNQAPGPLPKASAR